MNINFTDLEKLIKLAEKSDIKSLELTDGDARISIVCQSDGNENSKRNPNAQGSNVEQRPAASSADQKINKSNADDISTSVNDADEPTTNEIAKNQVSAPMLGTFYLRPEPTADTFFAVGDQIEAGQTLCIIEAMKMMYEVKADTSGILKEILVEEGDVVEYAQPLFTISPNG